MYSRPAPSTFPTRRIVSLKLLLPPSMMMSPRSSCGMSLSMNSSTGEPALTSNITRRGRLSLETNSSMLWAPIMLIPAAGPSTKSSTLETVRLNTATVKPWSAMFITRFLPITARPIRPISAVPSVIIQSFFPTAVTRQCMHVTLAGPWLDRSVYSIHSTGGFKAACPALCDAA